MMEPWISLVISLMALAGAVSGQAVTDPSIVNAPQTIQVNEHSAAVLKCRVNDLGANEVIWTFISHDFVIFKGDSLMTQHPSKYTLLHPNVGSIYDLQILDIETHDQGFYKCSAGPVSIIHHLDVIEMGSLQLPAIPDGINITDCCISKGVSEGCLPACYPPDIDLDTFDVRQKCESDILPLLECFNDGSNHDNCCLDRGVHRACLDLCHQGLPELTDEIPICFTDEQVNSLISCAVTGAELFPSAPSSVMVTDVNTAILVKWAPPEKNAEYVTGYKIMYRKKSEETYRSILLHDRGKFMHRLTDTEGISANQAYLIHVVALAKHGISLGSIETEIYVKDASLNEAMSKDIDDCCKRRDVSDSCRAKLCRSKTWAEFHSEDALSCFPFLGPVFTCLAAERNHTGCCAGFDVTSECLPLCSGKPPAFDATLLGCVAQMNVIEACVQQGMETQPAPAVNLRVEHVTNNLAQIAFDPSPSSDISRYLVLLRTGTDSNVFDLSKTLGPTTTSFQLANLEESTFYSIRIVAETAEEGSLPSETVSFLTYTDSFENPIEKPTQLDPYNLTECCIDSGMPLICAKGCEYRPDMTSYYREHLSTCYSSIGSVLACAADGRDHRDCCRRQGMSNELCYDLCVHTKQGPLDIQYAQACISDTATAVTCYNEGLVTLPRYPDVVVSDTSINTITLNWTHPLSGGLVDTYTILYKIKGAPVNDSKKATTDKTFLILQDLSPATAYEINVISVNDNGTSARSPTITVYTLEDFSHGNTVNITDVPQGRAFWQNITDCCENTVSEACREVCLNKESAMDQTDACFKESNQMLACFSDGQDHRVCCAERNLPSVCIPICAGNAASDSIAQATCMSYAHRDVILSCFLERQGLIPGAPTNFLVKQSEEADFNITLSWSTPEFCFADCYYTIYYWNETAPDNKITQKTTSTSALISVTTEDSYSLLVVAHNSYGSGPPSATRTLFMSLYPRYVKVYLDGDRLVVEEGQAAYLICSIAGFPETDIKKYDVRWVFNNHKTVGSGRQYSIYRAERKDEGTYTCEVTDYYTTSSASFYLPIKARPIFDQLKVDSVAPNVMGSSAKIACWFRGFPDSDPKAWTKDGQTLSPIQTRLTMNVDHRYDTGITSYRLKIANVYQSDYGEYSITVSNKFGSTVCHVRLSNPEEQDDVVVAPAVSNPIGCCADKGVSELCQELCGYHVDVAVVLQDVRYLTCLQHFDTFIECGADGRDHTKCCRESAVLPYCQPMCKGEVPTIFISQQEELLQCLGDWQPIMSCLKKGTEKVPYKPENVTLSLRNDGQDILISWSKPRLASDKVNHYMIYYTQIGTHDQKDVSLHDVQQYELKGLERMSFYNIWMTSGNKYGSSLPTPKLRIETFSFALNRPTNVNASVVPDTSDIHLSWVMRKMEYYNSFTLYYKRVIDSSYLQIHNIQGTSYNWTGLVPYISYKVYLRAEGPIRSSPSNIIEFVTPGYGEMAETAKRKDDFDGKKIAIGVGVTIGVMALIAIVALVLFFVFKARVSTFKVDDTVAYENPGYGKNESVKIHGMGDNSFGYGHFEEEAQAPQHTYDNSGFVGINSDPTGMEGESTSNPDGH